MGMSPSHCLLVICLLTGLSGVITDACMFSSKQVKTNYLGRGYNVTGTHTTIEERGHEASPSPQSNSHNEPQSRLSTPSPWRRVREEDRWGSSHHHLPFLGLLLNGPRRRRRAAAWGIGDSQSGTPGSHCLPRI